MAYIEVKIKISEEEYEEWNEYEKEGVEGVRAQLRQDFIDSCRRLGIKSREIEIEHNE